MDRAQVYQVSEVQHSPQPEQRKCWGMLYLGTGIRGEVGLYQKYREATQTEWGKMK